MAKTIPDKSAISAVKTVGIIILAILVICYIASRKSSEIAQDNSATESTSNVFSGHETHAFITAEKFVKNELLSPKSADFGYYDAAKVIYNGNSTYLVKNFVDCDNVYGVPIRHNFFITLDFKGGMWEDPNNWEVINFKIE